MTDLAQKKCAACEGGTAPLRGAQIQEYLSQLTTPWEIVDGITIRKEFKFKNFKEALDFVNKVGELAEQENHHPDIELGWGRVAIDLSTHAIGGLSENDFILAAKIESF
ncbi:MAG: 4a-hydroxytetrahydrobiopterin dehydratase [Parcubacteria group bacterium]|nr:4a-hydroxytetrahydrobiopterin dehydratase [Parcubacteria group bacterium]